MSKIYLPCAGGGAVREGECQGSCVSWIKSSFSSVFVGWSLSKRNFRLYCQVNPDHQLTSRIECDIFLMFMKYQSFHWAHSSYVILVQFAVPLVQFHKNTHTSLDNLGYLLERPLHSKFMYQYGRPK